MGPSKVRKKCYRGIHRLMGETFHAFIKGNQTKQMIEEQLVEIGGGLLGNFAIH
jgi:hypothetical protein